MSQKYEEKWPQIECAFLRRRSLKFREKPRNEIRWCSSTHPLLLLPQMRLTRNKIYYKILYLLYMSYLHGGGEVRR